MNRRLLLFILGGIFTLSFLLLSSNPFVLVNPDDHGDTSTTTTTYTDEEPDRDSTTTTIVATTPTTPAPILDFSYDPSYGNGLLTVTAQATITGDSSYTFSLLEAEFTIVDLSTEGKILTGITDSFAFYRPLSLPKTYVCQLTVLAYYTDGINSYNLSKMKEFTVTVTIESSTTTAMINTQQQLTPVDFFFSLLGLIGVSIVTIYKKKQQK